TLTDSGNNQGAFDVVQADLALSGGDVLAAGTYFLALHEGAWGSPSDGTAVWWAHDSNGETGHQSYVSSNLDGTGSWDSMSYEYAVQIFGGAPPTVGQFDGNTVSWIEGDGPVSLDFDGDATVIDLDSADLSSGRLDLSIS